MVNSDSKVGTVGNLASFSGKCQHGIFGRIQGSNSVRPVAAVVLHPLAENLPEKFGRELIVLLFGLVDMNRDGATAHRGHKPALGRPMAFQISGCLPLQTFLGPVASVFPLAIIAPGDMYREPQLSQGDQQTDEELSTDGCSHRF